jgi:hypothetical protein
MKITPKPIKTDVYEELTPLEQKTRKAAIILAFIGVFVWTAKILFF